MSRDTLAFPSLDLLVSLVSLCSIIIMIINGWNNATALESMSLTFSIVSLTKGVQFLKMISNGSYDYLRKCSLGCLVASFVLFGLNFILCFITKSNPFVLVSACVNAVFVTVCVVVEAAIFGHTLFAYNDYNDKSRKEED